MLRFHIAGLIAGLIVGLLTAFAGALSHYRTAPETVTIIEHVTVRQCDR